MLRAEHRDAKRDQGGTHQSACSAGRTNACSKSTTVDSFHAETEIEKTMCAGHTSSFGTPASRPTSATSAARPPTPAPATARRCWRPPTASPTRTARELLCHCSSFHFHFHASLFPPLFLATVCGQMMRHHCCAAIFMRCSVHSQQPCQDGECYHSHSLAFYGCLLVEVTQLTAEHHGAGPSCRWTSLETRTISRPPPACSLSELRSVAPPTHVPDFSSEPVSNAESGIRLPITIILSG